MSYRTQNFRTVNKNRGWGGRPHKLIPGPRRREPSERGGASEWQHAGGAAGSPEAVPTSPSHATRKADGPPFTDPCGS